MEFQSSILEGLKISDQNLFRTFGRGPAALCPFSTVQAAFLHHANSNPEAIAVIDKSTEPARSMTYGELHKHAAFLSRKLVQQGVGADTKVPIVIRRSVEMVVGIMGILIAGGQYVPLDGGVVPEKTLEHVFRNCGNTAPIVTSSSCVDRVQRLASASQTLIVEEIMEESASCWNETSPFTHSMSSSGDTGCYVIYTSGTTGEPKGVDVLHSNVTNLLCISPGNVGMYPGAKVGSVLSISFDMGAWETLGAMCNGSTLILRGQDWKETLNEIDVLICTPTILSSYDPTYFPNIKSVATAGEPLPQSTADLWSSAGKTLYTGCGPTEVTIVNTISIHKTGTPVCIGRPAPNNTVYVLDEDEIPVAIGSPGTLWAGGACVSRGYVSLPEKTAERWRLDPFIGNGSYMFNTGDSGYWLPNGTLQIIGRKDNQIKIKGFRVELDGVSSSLASCNTVHSAVAILHDYRIYGFVTPATADENCILETMKSKQPYYAIPEQCFPLDSFPETNNGKIDKGTLANMAKEILESQRLAVTSGDQNIMTAASNVELTEKAIVTVPSDKTTIINIEAMGPTGTSIAGSDSTTPTLEKTPPLPEKVLPKVLRNLRLRMLIVYRTLFSLVWCSNIAALVCILVFRANTNWIARMAYINLTVGVLIRQDHVVNLIYTIICSVPRSWPLFIRRRAAKTYHFGGVHSGSTSVAVAWYIASLIFGTWKQINTTGSINAPSTLAWLVLSWFTVGLLLGIVATAYPTFRKNHHDIFEAIHRFIGWTALGFIWISTVLDVSNRHHNLIAVGLSAPPLGTMLVKTLEFWLTAVITISIALSWVTLRKVEVESEVLSSHAVRLHFNYAVPVNGSFVRVSKRPLVEWHSFATIGAPEAVNGHGKGFSLIVSNAGDWTKDVIEKPLQKVWVRGVPTCGVMRITPLFRSLILLGTGSGIGPLLGFIQNPTCPYRLIWSTKSPQTLFGPDICDAIKKGDPGAVIHDTKVSGRPDLVNLAWREYCNIGAEAVVVIANEKLTKLVVYALEARGVPAYGAIWDS